MTLDQPAVTTDNQVAVRARTGAAMLCLCIAVAGLPAAVHLPGGAPLAAEWRLLLDPNVATAEELILLPGVGPALAQEIVTYREAFVPRPAFRTMDDLEQVRGIGPARLAKLRPYLRISHPTPAGGIDP